MENPRPSPAIYQAWNKTMQNIIDAGRLPSVPLVERCTARHPVMSIMHSRWYFGLYKRNGGKTEERRIAYVRLLCHRSEIIRAT